MPVPQRGKRVSRAFRFWRGNLRAKIMAWSFVPTAIILLAVALVTFFAFQRVTEELVLQRDLEVTFVSAAQLGAKLGDYEGLLNSLARTPDVYASDLATQRDTLRRLGNRLAIFDGGVVLLDAFGQVVATQPERPIHGQDWSDRSYYQEAVRSQLIQRSPELVLSDIVSDGPDGAPVIAFAVPIVDSQERFRGVMAGFFRVTPSATNAFYGDIIRLRLGGSGSIYLVDNSGSVIYHSDSQRIGEDFGAQSVVQQVLKGDVDAVRTRDVNGENIVAGFAPVPGTPWGLVNEESWSNLTSGFRQYQSFLLFLLALGVAVPAIVVYVGVGRVIEPIRELMRAAQEVAHGRFGQTISAKTGDEIEALAQQFNQMSAELQASYSNLEQKVADRTRELATLNAIAGVVSRSLDLDVILCDALDTILEMLELDAGAILLLEPEHERLRMHVTRGLSTDFLEAVPYVRMGEGIAGQAALRVEPVVMDIQDYPTEHLAPHLVDEGMQTIVSAPLVHQSQVLGVFNLASRRPRTFPPQELDLLTAIGRQIGVGLENARLYAQTEQELTERIRAEEQLRQVSEERARRNRELQLLNRVIAATTSRLEIAAVLEAVCHELTMAFDLPSAAAAMLHESGDYLTVVAEHRSADRPSAIGGVIPVAGNPSTQHVLREKTPLAILDAQHDPRMATVHDLMREQKVASLLLLPLIVRGEVVGTLGLDAVSRRQFTEEEISLAASAAAATAQALENARAEQRLRESEERLSLAMEGAQIGLWDQNLKTQNAMVIQDWTERLGYEAAELEPSFENWLKLMHPEDRPRFEETLDRYLAGETPLFELEHRVRTKWGDWAWILLRGQVVVWDEDGNPLRITGIHQNITARKRAEEALRRSQQRLSLHVQHTPLGYIEWDDQLRVVDWNPAAERMFDYSKEEAVNHHAYELIVPAKEIPLVDEIWQSILDQTGGARSTNQNITKDGRTIICEWYNTPLIDEDGQVIGLASLAQDITERVKAEEDLREAKEAAEAANQAKSIFLANMSHELRTPLNAILGFAQLMTHDPLLGSDQRENLNIIRRSGEHLLGLINDVLEMSKIEAGRETLQERSFDLYLMLEGLEDLFRLRAQEKGLMLILEQNPGVPRYVRMDEAKLRQVLMNLVGNAIKFTDEGGVTLRVRHDPQPASDRHWLHFEVEDTGPGIAEEELDALFDPFVQTETGRRSQEGTGLGLTISQRFVHLMGGELTVRTQVGRGSIFKFDVKMELADPSEMHREEPRQRVVGLEPDQPTYRLLIAEDSVANRKLLVSILAPLGFDVREAADGREAIEIWKQWEPHLIWMDLRMPVLDGYAATKKIKATPQGQATVIVALTASAFEEDRAMLVRGGCDHFLRKPFREEEIYDTLAQYLGVRFIYEEAELGEAFKEIEGPPSTALGAETLASLKKLPESWMTSLNQAAAQLDADLVLDLVDRIRDRDGALADTLHALVRDFRFDLIMSLTEPAEASNETTHD
jgi:PAS domain S-box-containing protein